jgi:membrane protein CcdC involved in cytochrome C biogenesis
MMVPLHVLSLIASILGAIVITVWRVQESRTAVTTKKILIPPLGMATGFCMFVVPAFRIPWSWAGLAFLAGAFGLAYPLLRTSRLVREGDTVMAQRSNAFFAVIIVLAGIRLGARSYLDTVLSVQQTAALFFILAFGMIARWRTQMFLQYRALLNSAASAKVSQGFVDYPPSIHRR